jgi:hypothetical protein
MAQAVSRRPLTADTWVPFEYNLLTYVVDKKLR